MSRYLSSGSGVSQKSLLSHGQTPLQEKKRLGGSATTLPPSLSKDFVGEGDSRANDPAPILFEALRVLSNAQRPQCLVSSFGVLQGEVSSRFSLCRLWRQSTTRATGVECGAFAPHSTPVALVYMGWGGLPGRRSRSARSLYV